MPPISSKARTNPTPRDTKKVLDAAGLNYATYFFEGKDE